METLAIALPSPLLEAAVEDDASLAIRACAGDAAALEQLLTRHEPAVRRCVARLTGRDEVDDLVQDVFVTVLERSASFRGGSAWGTWLLSIAVNRCRSHLRRERLRRRWLGWLAARPAEPMARRSSDDRLDRALATLRPADRELLVLKYFEDLPASEIAAVLGIGIGAVDVRLSRARARLKQLLEPSEANS